MLSKVIVKNKNLRKEKKGRERGRIEEEYRSPALISIDIEWKPIENDE